MKSVIRAIVASILIGMSYPIGFVLAEDTDIYAANRSESSYPNVLIVLDNSTNWSRNEQHWEVTNNGVSTSQGEMELKALYEVLSELGEVNVGLMMLTEGSGGSTYDGGYIRFHLRPMAGVDGAEANKAAFQRLIIDNVQHLATPSACVDGTNSVSGTPECILKNFDSPNEKVATAKSNYSNTLFEIFKYFGGYTSPAHALDGIQGTPWDASHFGPFRYSGSSTAGGRADSAAYKTLWSEYNSPGDPLVNCSKNYVIWIGNDPNLNVDAPSTLLQGVGGNTSFIPLPNLKAISQGSSIELATTACGTYSDAATCSAAAALAYPGYSSVTCQEITTGAEVCSASGTNTLITSLGTAVCGSYSTASACESDLAASYGSTYDSYSCSPSSCTYSQTLSPATVLANPTACISASNASACQTWAAAQFPGYSGFTCTNGTACGGGNKTWKVSASEQNVAGNSYAMSGSKSSAAGGKSFKIIGTQTYNAYEATTTSTTPSSGTNNYADEWARFLFQTDVSPAAGRQNIKTYVVDVRRLWQNDGDRAKTQLLMNMARFGGGKYFNAQDTNGIATALRKIFSEIQSVNSVFASSSLPVSVNAQGTYLNQIFIGMFRPYSDGSPRWAGNLKQYQFAWSGSSLVLADKNGDSAINSSTGFITPCAKSFWTVDSTNTYWDFPSSEAIGTCTPASAFNDNPDGDVVEKGGASGSLRIRDKDIARSIFTCDPAASCNSLQAFNSTNVTAAALGVADAAALINWVTGVDVLDENLNGNVTERRPSIHGGVVHSQPAVLDYGGLNGFDVVAFYGSDDGMLHAVRGDKTDLTGGKELWGFIAPETFKRLKRMMDNDPLVDFPGVTAIGAKAKEYFFDGSIATYKSGSTVWIFPTMRRGGRAVYAFDVSNPSTPSLLWRKGCFTNSTTDDTDCTSSEWATLGQTWSKPQIGYLAGYVDASSNPKPVLVFGGGYDTCEDTDSAVRCLTSPRKGANIWFVDAQTGIVIRKYSTNYSVAGEITLLTNAAGVIETAYAADSGGYVYRINVGSYTDGAVLTDVLAVDTGWTTSAAVSNITIANLSEVGQVRKFLFGPDVVSYPGYNAVLIGSGDREHPLLSDYPCVSQITNQFYMIKDSPTAYSSIVTPASLTDVTSTTSDATINDFGYRFDMGLCEQGVNKPLAIAGLVYFGTNQPQEDGAATCKTDLGVARSYVVGVSDGGVWCPTCDRSVGYEGGGLPPSPVAGIVEVDGVKAPFILGGTKPPEGGGECVGDACSSLGGGKVTINPAAPRYRHYWHMLKD